MELKILFSGLSDAGKTSIIRTLRKDAIADLRPTIDVEVTEIRFLGLEIISWDLGGQQPYRDHFIDHFQQYLQDTHILFYVLSVQDETGEEEALAFLETILTKLRKTTIRPHVGVLLHKIDPNIKHNPKIARYADKLEKKVHNLLRGSDISYLIFRTSIYDPISVMEAFALTLNSRFPKGEYLT